jgi:transcriptional regulator with XRE-family HTH domain
MRVMNDPVQAESPDMPSPEQRAGQQIRLLRQRRGWSQHEVAERMRAYGYDWSQAIVTRLEAATRPTRLNELVDLALLFEVPAMELLGFGAPDDFDAAEREIGELLTTHTRLREELSNAHSLALALQARAVSAQQEEAETAAALLRIDARIEVLAAQHPRYKHLAGGFEGLVDAVIRLRNTEGPAGGDQ